MRLGSLPLTLLVALFLRLSPEAIAIPLPGSLPGAPGETPIPETLITLALEVEEGGRNPGDPIHGAAIVSIAPEWHVNSATPKDDFSIPTVLTFDSAGVEIPSVVYPPHVERTFSFAGGELLAVYEGDLRIPFSGTREAAGEISLVATLSYQACNDRICLPPREVSATAIIAADGSARSGTPGGQETTSTTFTRLEDAPDVESGSLFSGDLGRTFEDRGLALTLVVVFVLGLALNLTPCVYPLIPLTIAYFSSQTGGRSRRVALASSYVLGLAAMYSALGVFSALSGMLFGAWLQLPAVLIFFALLMIVLSASMFGAFEIRVPHFIADRAGARGGLAGAATMGLLAGIVAAPCVGPFIISLIALVSQKGSVAFGFILFFVLALGLGLPYLILGIFSTAAASIPRSGPWMVQIKQALGFVLIAMAFYFLRPLLGDTVYHWGVGLSLLVGALFLLLMRRSSQGAFALRAVLGVTLFAASLFFLWPRATGPEVQWASYDEASLAAARVQGKPVIIDFYADWCLPCKELDARTFTDSAVVSESTRFVRLKADLTRPGPSTSRLTEQYGILGVPTIVFLDSSGKEIAASRLTGFEKPEPFLERMKSVR